MSFSLSRSHLSLTTLKPVLVRSCFFWLRFQSAHTHTPRGASKALLCYYYTNRNKLLMNAIMIQVLHGLGVLPDARASSKNCAGVRSCCLCTPHSPHPHQITHQAFERAVTTNFFKGQQQSKCSNKLYRRPPAVASAIATATVAAAATAAAPSASSTKPAPSHTALPSSPSPSSS